MEEKKITKTVNPFPFIPSLHAPYTYLEQEHSNFFILYSATKYLPATAAAVVGVKLAAAVVMLAAVDIMIVVEHRVNLIKYIETTHDKP